MRPSLTLVTSDSPAVLIERLALDLAREPLSPFDDEVVVVQSLGAERWVRHELARRHGCAASLAFPFPAAFCHRLAAGLLGADHPLDPRFERDALTWRVLDLLDSDHGGDPAFEPLARFTTGADTRKRLGLAARIAARFDEYQLYRPDVLLAWERGDDTHDSASPHIAWQATLWRRLCDGDAPPLHLARWLSGAIELLGSATATPAGLPPRVSVFGVSTLPPLFAALLRALANFVPVRAYVLATECAGQSDPGDRPADPLTAAFGDSVRELVALFGGAARENYPSPAPDSTPTALARLHAMARHGVAGDPAPIAHDDDSLTVHVCHSPVREVEVLRDQLLAALAADATLRPHDILVLVPDITEYAPLVEGVFDVGERELPRIPHRIADRAAATESPLADAALRIVRLAGSRWTAPEILELLDIPAVRRAARITAGGRERILDWIRETRIRWGRDGAMRREYFALPAINANTWSAGLERLIMGYAAGREETLVAGVLPCAGDSAGDPDTLGAFARWTAILFDTLHDWREPRTPAAWSGTLRDALTRLLEPEGTGEERAMDVVLRALDSLREAGTVAGCHRPMDVAVIRDWLERALTEDTSAAGFLSGGMTVCELKPMRAIPFRVIAMLGLNDGTFPRGVRRTAYDLLEIEHREGDRDLRASDRQLFLDTILSARDRLILSYVGRSERDNSERAPSVVVAELLDIAHRCFTTGDTPAPIVVQHRLQPFSPAYYGANGGGETRPLFSFSRANARATAASAARRRIDPFVRAPVVQIPPNEQLDIALDDLVECWTNPARFFCRRVLDLRLPADRETSSDCEPMTVEPLTRYEIQQRLLECHLRGTSTADRERELALAGGILPCATLGELWFDKLHHDIRLLLDATGTPELRDPVPVHITGDSWTITGRIGGITAHGRIHARAATLKPKDRISAWITHVALCTIRPDTTTRVIATDDSFTLRPAIGALARLEELVAGYRAALCAPLPVFEHASMEYVRRTMPERQRRATTPPLEAARRAFAGDGFGTGDATDRYIALCWRGCDPFEKSLADFTRLSETLWLPILRSGDTDVQGATA